MVFQFLNILGTKGGQLNLGDPFNSLIFPRDEWIYSGYFYRGTDLKLNNLLKKPLLRSIQEYILIIVLNLIC